MKISATLIAQDEENNLPRALRSLSCCDEIVIVDSGSRDRTMEIARQFGAKVIQHDWLGYAAQKNLAAQAAENDWILALDADEELSERLQAEIQAIKHRGPAFDAYRFPRLAQYLGQWIFHSGWYPDRKVRLYDRRKARWVGEFVHESVAVDGRVGTLAGNLLHYTCPTFSHHVRTVDRYTNLAAQELRARGKRVHLGNLLLAPPWAFFRSYVLKLGFLDGFRGLLIAEMAAFYVFAKYVKAKYSEPAAVQS